MEVPPLRWFKARDSQPVVGEVGHRDDCCFLCVSLGGQYSISIPGTSGDDPMASAPAFRSGRWTKGVSTLLANTCSSIPLGPQHCPLNCLEKTRMRSVGVCSWFDDGHGLDAHGHVKSRKLVCLTCTRCTLPPGKGPFSAPQALAQTETTNARCSGIGGPHFPMCSFSLSPPKTLETTPLRRVLPSDDVQCLSLSGPFHHQSIRI